MIPPQRGDSRSILLRCYTLMTQSMLAALRGGRFQDSQMAGWTYACPESIGWLAPSRFIDEFTGKRDAHVFEGCIAGLGH
jgi:hypothetical protein